MNAGGGMGLSPLRAEAEEFLAALDPGTKQFTFQTFDDDSERKDKDLAFIRNGTLEEHWAELVQLNAQGVGIFVTINRTDLKGRKANNITDVRSTFVDLDGAPLEPVLEWKQPHLVIESSPGRWHAYWLTYGLPLKDFRAVQKALIARFDADQSVHDLPRVMRLPGFIHRKGEPFLTRILQNNDHAPYAGEDFERAKAGGKEKFDAAKAAESIASGEHYYRPMLGLLGIWAKRMPREEAERRLRELFERVPEEKHDERWHEYYGKIAAHAKGIYKKEAEKTATGEGGPTIRIKAAELQRMVDEAEDALVEKGTDIYRQAHRLVRPVWDTVPTARGPVRLLRISHVQRAHLLERFPAAATFLKWVERDGEWAPTGCPKDVVDAYIARDGQWKLRPLLGVATAPTLRRDGKVLEAEGYDEDSGLLLDFNGVTFPPVPENPTRADAERALAVLKKPIAKFPFVKKEDEAVALSGIMTPVVRRSMPVAPAHSYSSPEIGSGKSLLVDMACVIATGDRVPGITTGKDKNGDAELEKRITAAMLSGAQVISIGNVSHALGGDFLCEAISQEQVGLRVFGTNDKLWKVPNTFTVFLNGTNLAVLADMTRRVLRCDIDAKTERPELREFDFHPVEYARAHRPELVVAVLTIIRAYLTAGAPQQQAKPLGNFDEWSRLVRSPLMWLGEADPVLTIEKVRKSDPRRGELRAVFAAWHEAKVPQQVQVRGLVKLAMEVVPPNEHGEGGGDFIYPELHDALLEVAAGGRAGGINSRALSHWLRRNQQRPVRLEDGRDYRLERDDSYASGDRWTLTSEDAGGAQ